MSGDALSKLASLGLGDMAAAWGEQDKQDRSHETSFLWKGSPLQDRRLYALPLSPGSKSSSILVGLHTAEGECVPSDVPVLALDAQWGESFGAETTYYVDHLGAVRLFMASLSEHGGGCLVVGPACALRPDPNKSTSSFLSHALESLVSDLNEVGDGVVLLVADEEQVEGKSEASRVLNSFALNKLK